MKSDSNSGSEILSERSRIMVAAQSIAEACRRSVISEEDLVAASSLYGVVIEPKDFQDVLTSASADPAKRMESDIYELSSTGATAFSSPFVALPWILSRPRRVDSSFMSKSEGEERSSRDVGESWSRLLRSAQEEILNSDLL